MIRNVLAVTEVAEVVDTCLSQALMWVQSFDSLYGENREGAPQEAFFVDCYSLQLMTPIYVGQFFPIPHLGWNAA